MLTSSFKSHFLIILVAVIWFFQGCDDAERISQTDILFFIDVTDTLYKDIEIYKSDIDAIFNRVGLDIEEGGNSGLNISFFILNETTSKPLGSVSIEKSSNSIFDDESNKYNRIDKIKAFKSSLVEIMEEIIEHNSKKKSRSKLYQQICRELNRLTKFSNADEKVVIVYSDMLEHSDLFSFYGKGLYDINRWMESKDRLLLAYKQKLSLDCKLPTADDGMGNVELYFITKRTAENDDKVNLAEKFWAALLTSQGIEGVYFGSKLKFY